MNTIEEKLQKQFVIPVIRGTDPAIVEGIVEALFHGGFAVQEVTLMSPQMIPLLGRLRSRLGVTLGAGTVLDGAQATVALAEGVEFLVSPGFSSEVSATAKAAGRLYIPGVMTPTEIMVAQHHGHQLLKLFPVSNLGGLGYLRSLQGPFPDTRWMLSGGIKAQEARSYQQSGVSCVGVGQDLFPRELVERRAWDEVTALARSVRP